MTTEVHKRFIRYTKIDTQSDPKVADCPSTKKQFDLAKRLVAELNGMGLEDVSMDENGYVMASLPSNSNAEIPTIGFIAHLDTAPDLSGKNVKPQIVTNYDGKDIVLNKEKKIVLSPNDFPELLKYVGQDLITTDGTTLLGADDKAGVAEIMTAIEYLCENPEIEHGTIKIGFTPDEEIGRGADLFDVEKFGADFAYTMDGGEIGELEYENFNASMANIKINGRNVHPGTAKNQMINSMMIAMELHAMLPANERPEHTDDYEGFFLLTSINGTVETTEMAYIIRDHDLKKYKQKNKLLKRVVKFLNKKYGKNVVELKIVNQYYNMKEKIEPIIHIVDTAEQAMREVGIEPIKKAIRGGTDGARLSFMGLPTPNIFAGGHNFHGKFEYIPIQSMQKAVEVILKIIELNTKVNN